MIFATYSVYYIRDPRCARAEVKRKRIANRVSYGVREINLIWLGASPPWQLIVFLASGLIWIRCWEGWGSMLFKQKDHGVSAQYGGPALFVSHGTVILSSIHQVYGVNNVALLLISCWNETGIGTKMGHYIARIS